LKKNVYNNLSVMPHQEDLNVKFIQNLR